MSIMMQLDGYKLDHRRQYPKGTTKVYSNWTPRSSRLTSQDGCVFFGLQYYLKRYMMEEFNKFFLADVEMVCEEYQQFTERYLGPNGIGTEHIRALHGLGYVPLEFRALSEGTLVPLRVPALTIENTHPDFAWLVNYFETLMSSVLWKPCTSATQARLLRKVLDTAAAKTGGAPDFVPWQGHDFSFRGMSGPEDAALSGAGHLLYFTGTDTIPAIRLVDKYYSGVNGLVGASVAATEHSVMCAGGRDDELETISRLLDLYPTGILSVVSDTWDLWHVITKILPQLKEKILARQGKLVIRPDSGNPAKILCGDSFMHGPAHKGVIELLWDIFGGTVNAAGFKELDPHIGAIYGDSINLSRAEEICEGLRLKGFASTNTVLGVGSYTYQYVTRDTLGFALKTTWVEIDGKGHSIFKQPVTDDGTKNSARGRLAVTQESGKLVLTSDATMAQVSTSMLAPVWVDGEFLPGRDNSFAQVRRVATGG